MRICKKTRFHVDINYLQQVVDVDARNLALSYSKSRRCCGADNEKPHDLRNHAQVNLSARPALKKLDFPKGVVPISKDNKTNTALVVHHL